MRLHLITITTILVLCVAASGQRPNFLVVLVDDVGVDKVGAYGEHPDAGPTPVIDALARQGQLYRNAYAMPVCSPTRATTLTGRLPFRHGIGMGAHGGPYQFPLGTELTLPTLFGRYGYRTAAIGKWHLGNVNYVPTDMHAVDFGFDRHLGSRLNVRDYFVWEHVDADQDGFTLETVNEYVTTRNVDDALQLVGEGGEFELDPWFLWFSFNAPHLPLHVPPAQLHDVPLTGGDSDALLYAAMLQAADTELGRLLANIRPEVLERTYIIVLGDNGTYLTATTPPFGGSFNHKGSVKEGGINVPFVIHGPGVLQGEVRGLVSVTDIFPTLIQLIGEHPPRDLTLDGTSLVPYFSDPGQASLRRIVFAQSHMPNGPAPYSRYFRSIRNLRYKWIRRTSSTLLAPPAFALYDLWEDPFEELNLVSPFFGIPKSTTSQEAIDAMLVLDEQMLAFR